MPRRNEMGDAWPEDSVAVFQDALPLHTLAAAVAESEAWAACEPNFWMPRAAIEQACARNDTTASGMCVCA